MGKAQHLEPGCGESRELMRAREERYQSAWYPSLRQLCAQLRRVCEHVTGPVHVFNIPPQFMRGLCSVAAVTDDGVLHRCVVSYAVESNIRADLAHLHNLFQWAELTSTEGRIEVGVNTGELLRYFLPNLDQISERSAMYQRYGKSLEDWLAAVQRLGPEWKWWRIEAPDGSQIEAISSHGVHCLLRRWGEGTRLKQAAQRLFGLTSSEELGADSALYRDVMGDWRERER